MKKKFTEEKQIYPVLDFLNVNYHTKKKKDIDKITQQSILKILITILNIYNSLNNIKFTKKKVKKKFT